MATLPKPGTDALDEALSDWLRKVQETRLYQIVPIQIVSLFSLWRQYPEQERRTLLRHILGSSMFVDLCKQLDRNRHQLGSALASNLQRNDAWATYKQIDQLVSSVQGDLQEHFSGLGQHACLRLLIQCAFSPKEQSSGNKAVVIDDDLASSKIRDSFATPFQGPAVELLLAHIQVLERGIQRTAELRKAVIEQAIRQQMIVDVEMQDVPTNQDDGDPQNLDYHSYGRPAGSQHVQSSPIRKRSSVSMHKRTCSEPPPSETLSSAPVDLYYAKVLPIIQSSGFGKTKLCVHLSADQPGMLVCMRPKADVSVSFPPQDTPVFDYFQACYQRYFKDELTANSLTITNMNHIHAFASSFLGAYCFELHHTLSELMRVSGCFPQQTAHIPNAPFTSAASSTSISLPFTTAHHEVGKCWASVVFSLAVSLHSKPGFLQNLKLQHRHPLCPHSHLKGLCSSPVDDQASANLIMDFPAQDRDFIKNLVNSTARADLLARICKRANTYLGKYIPSRSSDGYNAHVENFLVPALSSLENLVPPALADTAIIFLALDECVTFSKILPHLRRVWNAAKPARSWVLLIDTNSRIAPMVGPEARCASSRTVSKSTRLMSPFVDMPLDVTFTHHHRDQVRKAIFKKQFKLRDLNMLLSMLGRPLWKDSNYRHTKTVIQPQNILMKLVQPDHWQWPTVLSDADLYETSSQADIFQNLMAMVSQRVALENSVMANQTPWLQFVREQVSCHLRFLCEYHQDTDVLTTHVPSEPVLSLSAAWSFRRPYGNIAAGSAPSIVTTAQKWSMVIRAIASAHHSIGLNVGLQGEEGVRIVCSLAADLAASVRYRTQLAQQTCNYESVMGLITLSEWLERLIGRNYEAPDHDFHDWCSRQWMNFKHVADLEAQIKHGNGIPVQTLGEFWMRHAAIRGVSNQCGWDLLIPIYESNRNSPPIGDQPFLMDRLSYVAVQAKNCQSKPSEPTVIGPALPDRNEPTQLVKTLELFLDVRELRSLRTCTIRQHRDQPMLKAYRILISGHSTASFPLLEHLDASAQSKVPVILGLPTTDVNDFEVDMTSYVRQCSDVTLSDCFRHARCVKEGKLNLTGCMPSVEDVKSDKDDKDSHKTTRKQQRRA